MIVGYGEIGQSIHRLYEGKLKTDYTIITKDSNDVIEIDGIRYCGSAANDIMRAYTIDIMHVCIPYTEFYNFVDTCVKYAKKYEPDIIIIHSTVAQGTTDAIQDQISGISEVVHSPIMGKHPNLTESIKTFRKIIGSNNFLVAQTVAAHFQSLGIESEIFESTYESELAKLFSTTYYGTLIRYMQEVYKHCKELNVDFDQVYVRTNQIYNEGYTKLGEERFVRPILSYTGRGVGGHCVLENAVILNEEALLPEFTNIIIREGKTSKKDANL